MKKRLLLLTGPPGVGKTTALLRIAEALKAKGYGVGGMISRDVRRDGSRIGFEVMDFSDGRTGVLATVNQNKCPRVGKYHVELDDLNRVGVNAILRAVENLDVVIVDEIGPMELFSEQFREVVRKAFESQKLVLCTIHWKMTDNLIDSIKKREDSEMYMITHENRQNLPKTVIKKATDFLSKS